MKALTSLQSEFDLKNVFHQMAEIYGEQSHIPWQVLLKVSRLYPELFMKIDGDSTILAHLVILPLNQRGYEKIMDDTHSEADFIEADFEFDFLEKKPIFFFVYSIYGANDRMASLMIKQVRSAVEKYESVFTHASFLFAECVTPQGVRVSERMGLRKFYEYIYEGETLHLYKASFKEYLSVSQRECILQHTCLHL